MAGDDPDVRKKHHRFPEDGADESSKRRKHSHLRCSHRLHHRHRHRSSKRDRDGEEDISVPPPVVDDDKEEGEILEEGEFVGTSNGDVDKKKSHSDAESGEIKSDELFDRSDHHRNNNLGGHDDGFSGELEEVQLNTGIPQRENDLLENSAADIRDNNTDHGLRKCSDKTLKKMDDEVDEPRKSMDERFNYTGEDSEIGEIDESNTGSGSVKLSKNKGERRRSSSSHREGTLGGHKSRGKYLRNENGLKSPREGTKIKKDSENVKTVVLRRHGQSRSPSHRKENDSSKHRKRDARGMETDKYRELDENDSASYVPRRHVESMDIERNRLRNGNRSVSPEITDEKYTTVVHSPSHAVYHEEAHIKNRSRSRNYVRERRSRSRSYLQDEKVYHAESDIKSYRDNNDRVKPSGLREKDRHESDIEKVVRLDREQRHDSRDLTRDRERECSSNYSRHNAREDRHGSRDTWDKERGRDREREHSSSYSRHGYRDDRHDSVGTQERDMHRERGRERDKHRDKIRDDDRDRGKRNREREREKERGRDGCKDSRHLNHDESEHHRDRKRYRGQGKLGIGEEKLKRDEDEQEDYEERVELKLAAQEEEDIEKIKEESRKRREAILEKYRQQQLQKQLESQSESSRKDDRDPPTLCEQMEKPSTSMAVVNSFSEGFVNKDGSDVFDADPLFSVGKSPQKNGSSAFERTLGAGGLGDGTPKSERSEDMFCDDIFGESPAGVRKTGKGDGLQVVRSGLNDNWDDAEGYYSYRFGEVLDGRYEVIAAHGKGVFSTVVRAKDLKAGKGEPEEVAIKIIRSNDTMYKAGLEELIILKKLAGADPEDRRHCVRFLSSFKYRNHLCLVFESLHMNLREVLKKFGRNIGLKLTAVRAYAKQLFIALKHLRNCGVLHCDIKPDNMLVNEMKNVLKLCDFGNAMFAGKNEVTPYLVSRFYRAPEIILGLSYDHPMDMWSVGCCLYELYSGKVLFPGPSNNDMLRLHMELKGPFPKKMLRKGAFADHHFDHDLNFYSTEEDPVTKKTLKRLVVNHKPKDIGTIITGSAGEDPKMLATFKDLLERIFLLDPDKRLTVSQALSHPFITGK